MALSRLMPEAQQPGHGSGHRGVPSIATRVVCFAGTVLEVVKLSIPVRTVGVSPSRSDLSPKGVPSPAISRKNCSLEMCQVWLCFCR